MCQISLRKQFFLLIFQQFWFGIPLWSWDIFWFICYLSKFKYFVRIKTSTKNKIFMHAETKVYKSVLTHSRMLNFLDFKVLISSQKLKIFLISKVPRPSLFGHRLPIVNSEKKGKKKVSPIKRRKMILPKKGGGHIRAGLFKKRDFLKKKTIFCQFLSLVSNDKTKNNFFWQKNACFL